MPGIPGKYSDAVQAIADGRSQLRSVGKVSYHKSQYPQVRYMANAAGIGFDAFVNHKFNHLNEKGRRGRWRHMWNAFKAVFGYYSTSVRVWIDDELSMDERVYSASIVIDYPEGAGAGGVFDVAVIRRLGRLGVLRRFNSLCSGNIDRLDGVELDSGRKIRIDSFPEVQVEIDGEALWFSPLEFEIADDAVNVVVTDKEHNKTD